ncbi:acyl-coenzyme A diphosphatase NUDT19-like isoform X1 [Conger conger]|uniref:acyl-coenzyme A diphosphatase NUDT19-like isoform X1 n=1 Tax=Conger conger TaxID=82655 RepID=UPI002A5AA7C7|nr:acyl-coenzyme A diphosphatase NUDT19-like isoform X1 [Conger conger]
MNSALKHWKEAATVILAARTGCNVKPSVINSLKTREIPSPPNFTKSDLPHKPVFDYEVLLMKRSSKAGFMPNVYVFPGGVVEPSDFSSDWLETFKSFRHWPNFGLGLVKQPPETRPPIFATNRRELGSPIPSVVALRICAVRETFEESGILLVVPKNEENNIDFMSHRGGGNNSTSLTRLHELLDKRELARWRALVTENPFNFIRMCRELDCMPNIWAMHEWGNWLTPLFFDTKRRYDTASFICCLQEVPYTAQDEKEIVNFKWSTPSEVLQRFPTRELLITIPQIYELGRMCHYPQLQELHSFAGMRAAEGCEQLLGVELACVDCDIYLLPGDTLYPENVELSEERGAMLSTEKSYEQLQQESAALHRLVYFDLYTVAVHMNITPKYKHLRPIGAPSQTHSPRPKSRL